MSDAPERYSLYKTDGSLIFRTAYFRAGEGSVLHSGIYSKELAASIAAGGVVIVMLFVLVTFSGGRISGGITPFSFFGVVLAIGLFVVLALLFRIYVFKGRYLETILDRQSGKAVIYFSGIFRKKKDEKSLNDIKNIVIESKKTGMENPEGVEFVEKIAVQHGMAIPGFGEEKTFYQLTLKFADGQDRVIFADTDMDDVIGVHAEIKEFLNI